MTFSLLALLTILGMFAGTLAMLEAGRRLGRRRNALDPVGARAANTGAIDGAVFGLMGLLVAFTFSGAAKRFDTRREMIVAEVNAIGTAWQRLDLLPAPAQSSLREKFRQYLDARIEAFRRIPDYAGMDSELARAGRLELSMWAEAISACRDSGSQSVTMLVLPALNEMFGAATQRTAGTKMHPPLLIYIALGLLLLAASLIAGYGLGVGKLRDWVHALAFVIVMTLTAYVILDFEFPRVGFIRIHGFEQVLVDLRESINR